MLELYQSALTKQEAIQIVKDLKADNKQAYAAKSPALHGTRVWEVWFSYNPPITKTITVKNYTIR